ncbi:uncharacterized protein BYT42DRAFT_544527 [Radiomyces spectabilis]|uniref:uncharacterized protein n=1 Tax=Radiomyces spectabilis TaxID=64574 RepID=UPI00221E5397|nr:uncharacterized protein BYT42DRAFT_544527 [Radiomyces spectabilis]KAI8384657.1 hypothetical protein BYT42DRAFT_544527 [Radiomyces spectabilis]
MATYIDNVKATIALRRFLGNTFTTAHYNLLAELIESPLSLVVNNHQGVLSREHNTENDLPQFYIRVQELDRNELLDTLPLYSKNFPSDKDWVTEVIGQLEQKPGSISVSLLYAGVTTSTTAQKCAEADRLQSKSGGTRLLNWFSLTTGRHPSVFTIQKFRLPPVTDREHFYTQIGYI